MRHETRGAGGVRDLGYTDRAASEYPPPLPVGFFPSSLLPIRSPLLPPSPLPHIFLPAVPSLSSPSADIEEEEDLEHPSSMETLESKVEAEGGLQAKPEHEPLFTSDDGIGAKVDAQ